jgi:hypothetical protein
MDRAMIEAHLVLVEQHIAKSERHVARQRELVAELHNDGHDTLAARELLERFEEFTSCTSRRETGCNTDWRSLPSDRALFGRMGCGAESSSGWALPEIGVS